VPLFLIVLFIVVPIAELYVIIQVGEAIGLWPTLALLLADALLGSFLLKHQGRGALRRFNEALAQRRFPGKEVVDGLLIVVGGTLLLAPGFLTDIVGLILLIPPSRAVVRGLLRRFTVGRFMVVGMPGGGGAARGPSGGPAPDYDFDATAEEVPVNPKRHQSSRELPPTD
jgi:UPF0716 protein FxsA